MQLKAINGQLDEQRQEALDALADLVVVQRQGEEKQAQLVVSLEALQRSAASSEVRCSKASLPLLVMCWLLLCKAKTARFSWLRLMRHNRCLLYPSRFGAVTFTHVHECSKHCRCAASGRTHAVKFGAYMSAA